MIQGTILLILLGGSLTVLVFTVRNSSCGKVIFSQVSVCPQVGRAWQGGMYGRVCVWPGACMAGGMCGSRGHVHVAGVVWQGVAWQTGVHNRRAYVAGGGLHGR